MNTVAGSKHVVRKLFEYALMLTLSLLLVACGGGGCGGACWCILDHPCIFTASFIFIFLFLLTVIFLLMVEERMVKITNEVVGGCVRQLGVKGRQGDKKMEAITTQ